MDLYIAALTEWENPDEYQKLLERLTESYQPVGAAEELEVQQIAVCWWKRSRAWRYENAEIAIQLCKRHAELSKWETLSSEDQAHLATLKNAAMEIEAAGELSEELKQKMFADAEFRKLWDFAGEELNELLARRLELPLTVINKVRDSRPDAKRSFLLGTSWRACQIIVRERLRLAAESEKLANDIEAIPRPEALDRVLRAEAAIERSLNLSIDRLESLQRRRKGEAVPPPVRVRLSR